MSLLEARGLAGKAPVDVAINGSAWETSREVGKQPKAGQSPVVREKEETPQKQQMEMAFFSRYMQ